MFWQPVILILLTQATFRVQGEGLSGENCKGKAPNYCRGARGCYEVPKFSSGLFELEICSDTSSAECVCIEVGASCDTSEDCGTNERCTEGTILGGNTVILSCFACSVNPDDLNIEGISWEDVDDKCPRICVSVDALSGFSPEELVFGEHRRTSVLCDHYENCATPGHMVLYSGRAMMMRTYCEQLQYGCSQRVKFVNSPRMKAGLRIETKSESLKFLAFAASYESRTEEAFIAGLVRLGF